MAIVPKSVLTSYFETGDTPTQSQFATLISSLVGLVDDRYLMGLRQYDPSKLYLAGDSAIYNNSVYECIADTTGTFDTSKWQVIASLGSVVYSGTWDAIANDPALTSGEGSKGHYYVVSNASANPDDNTELDGIKDWGVTDWVIFNGTVWEKVDNSEAQILASDVDFIPGCGITSVNVQDAVIELCNNTNASIDLKIDKPLSFTAGDISVFSAGGNLDDSGKTIADFMPSTAVASDIPSTPSGTITATNVQGALDELDTKKMPVVPAAVDGNIGTFLAGTVVDSGFASSDFLPSTTDAGTLNFAPFDDIVSTNVQDAVEEVYTNVNTALGTKTDKAVPAVSGNFAGLDATGNLVDSTKNASSFLASTTVALDIPSTPSGGISATNVQDALNELDSDKMPKVPAATDGNFGTFSGGTVIDSGFTNTDFLPSTTDASTLPFTPFDDITATDVQDAVQEVYANVNADLNTKTDKAIPSVNGNFAALDATGNLVDSTKNATSFLASTTVAANIPFTPVGGISATDVQSAIAEVETDTDTKLADKMDTVPAATDGNFGNFNSGTIVDSGLSASSFLPSSTVATNIPFTPVGGISATNVQNAIAEVETDTDTKLADKMNTVPAATDGNFGSFSSGTITDSGLSSSSFLPSSTVATNIPFTPVGGISATNVQNAIAEVETDTDTKLTGKMNTVPAATDNRIAIFSSGSVVDSGKLISQYLATDNTTSYTPSADYNPATKLYVDNKFAAVPSQVKSIALPFTFSAGIASFTTDSPSWSRFPTSASQLRIVIPPAGTLFPGTTSMTAMLIVDYLTSNGTTSGNIALYDFTTFGTLAPFSGSTTALPTTTNTWQILTGSSFTLTTARTVELIVQRTAGTGNIQVEAVTLLVTYN